MSSRTSSRSTLTMVPSTMSPSLKYLMVLSMAARKSSAEPMSLTATCGEVTEGLGMWWVAPDRLGRRDSCYWCDPQQRSQNHRRVPVEVTRLGTRWTNSVAGRSRLTACQRSGASYPALVSYAGPPQQPLQFVPPYPPLQRKVRKVGAPLGVLIALGTIAGLIVIALTAFNPVGTAHRIRAVQHRDDGRRAGLPVVGPVGAGAAAAADTRLPVGRVGRRHHRVDTSARRRGRDQPGAYGIGQPRHHRPRRAADRGGGQGAVPAAHDDRRGAATS